MKLRKLKRFGRRPRRKSLNKETNHSEKENIKIEMNGENKNDDAIKERVRRESENSKHIEKNVKERSANWNHPSPPCVNVPVQKCRSVPKTSCQMVFLSL